MPLHSAQAFVLRTYNFAEADKVCVLLTHRDGKIRGIAHGARKMRSRFGSSLEPLTEINVTYYQKEGRELVSISHAEIVRSHFDEASASIEAGAAMSYISELVSEFVPDHEPNETVYRLVRATLDAIGQGSDPVPLLRYFEVWLLKLSGFFPDLKRCVRCETEIHPDDTLFLTSEGMPRCAECSGGNGMRIGASLRVTLTRVLAESPARFVESPAPDEQLQRLGDINYQIVRHALERDLKSFALFNRLRREARTVRRSENTLPPAARGRRKNRCLESTFTSSSMGRPTAAAT
jgi:DNA repair protein RecO (recombination protein O)